MAGNKGSPLVVTSWGKCRVTFLAMRETIDRDLKSSGSLLAAFVSSGANKSMGYDSFRRYCARYLGGYPTMQTKKAGSSESVEAAVTTRSPVEGPSGSEVYGKPEVKQRKTDQRLEIAPRPKTFQRLGGVATDHLEELFGPRARSDDPRG